MVCSDSATMMLIRSSQTVGVGAATGRISGRIAEDRAHPLGQQWLGLATCSVSVCARLLQALSARPEFSSHEQEDQSEAIRQALQSQDLEAVEVPEEVAAQLDTNSNDDGAQVVLPVILINEDEAVEPEQQQFYQMVEENAEQPVQEVEEDTNVALKQVLQELSKTKGQEPEKRSTDQSSLKLSSDEEKQLDQYVKDILNNRNPDLKALNSNQLEKLISFIGSLQTVLTNSQQPTEDASAPEIEEIIPLTSENSQDQLLLLKKDSEKFNNADMGLANTVHKIVKGGIQRVEGNRVYLKVAKDNITEEELYKLIAYLDRKIAEPNSLYFDEFLYEDEHQKKKKTEKELENASGVAQAVYKRRKDIQTLAGVQVDETGIGSGVDVVPVERAERDWLFVPILAVCALTIASLVSVLAVHMQPCTVYEDLCRQRMNTQDVPIAVNIGKATSSKHSSTSSCRMSVCCKPARWTSLLARHLSFLQDCLKKPNEISDQWTSLEHYESNTNTQTSVASIDQNADKNFDKSVIPYDESCNTYINASKIHDSDPRQIAYVATQSPLQNTANDFWQMVWEQGIALIVNLCDQEDMKSLKCIKYWPEEGSKVYGKFEIYLVSEHIWSEDTWKINKSYPRPFLTRACALYKWSWTNCTYCLIDMAINRIEGVKELNIAGSLEYLRDQRMRMVENEEQYKFVFSCVAEVSSLLKNLQH
uniref:Tyrosine-protein phosphatase domain-containing protein n=1 Tax=Ditylenchus dipsaci TaxID=166011 RepID=A0A915DPI8_9BILA